MARRKTFYGAAGRAVSRDTLSQDRVSRASPQRVETSWGESARWPKGAALPCRPGVTAEEAPREPRRVWLDGLRARGGRHHRGSRWPRHCRQLSETLRRNIGQPPLLDRVQEETS